MSDDLLYKVFMVLIILATIMFIVVLWRLYLVLTDLNSTTKVVKKRVSEFDLWATRFGDTLNNVTDVIEGFVITLSQFGKIRDKIKSFISKDDDNSQEGKNGQK